MDEYLYFPVFLAAEAALASLMAFRMLVSPDSQITSSDSKNNLWICVPLCLVLTIWLGNRPVDGYAFGDTFSYAHMYENVVLSIVSASLSGEWLFNWLILFCREIGLNVHQFFTVIEAVYVFTALWAVKRLLPRNPLLGMVFMWGSLMYFSFGVNGLRNGMACHIVLLAMSYFLDSRYIVAGVLSLLAFGIHRSVALPLASMIASRWLVRKPETGLGIWLGSIVLSLLGGNIFINFFASLGFDDRMEHYGDAGGEDFGFSSTGFRWDFLVYSAMPVIMGYWVLIRRGIEENWYRVLFNTYCLANAFWVLVIRAAFTNRFAYLSWFMYPVLIAYPLIMMRVWPDQDRRTGYILLAYVGFTLVMNIFYW